MRFQSSDCDYRDYNHCVFITLRTRVLAAKTKRNMLGGTCAGCLREIRSDKTKKKFCWQEESTPMLWYKYDGRIIFAPQMIGAILHELRPCSWTCGKTPEASVSHFSILL